MTHSTGTVRVLGSDHGRIAGTIYDVHWPDCTTQPLLLLGLDGAVELRRLDPKTLTLSEPLFREESRGAGFTSDHRWVLVGNVGWWNLTTNTFDAGPHNNGKVLDVSYGLLYLQFSPDCQRAVALATYLDHVSRVYSLPSGRCRKNGLTSYYKGDSSWCMAVSPSATLVVAQDESTRFRVMSAINLKCDYTSVRADTSSRLAALAFAGENVLVVATQNGKVVRIDTRTHEVLEGTGMLETAGEGLAVATRKSVAGHAVVLWSNGAGCVLTEKTVQPFKCPSGTGRDGIFLSGDGRTALALHGGTLGLIDLRTGAMFEPSQGHTSAVGAVEFLQGDHAILSGSDDLTLRCWNLQDGTVSSAFEGHHKAVAKVLASPDGKQAFSMAQTDFSTAELFRWDVETQQGADLHCNTNAFQILAVSPDGRWLAHGEHSLYGLLSIPRVLELGTDNEVAIDIDPGNSVKAFTPCATFVNATTLCLVKRYPNEWLKITVPEGKIVQAYRLQCDVDLGVFSRDGDYFAALKGQPLPDSVQIFHAGRNVWSMEFRYDGRPVGFALGREVFVCIPSGNELHVHYFKEKGRLVKIPWEPQLGAATSVALSWDERKVAVGTRSGAVLLCSWT